MIESAQSDLTLNPHSVSAGKRGLDLIFAATALILLLPFLALLVLAIVAESPGNPIFSQERVGRNGRHFRMWKLRTMVPNAAAMRAGIEHLNEMQWPMFKVRRDPRITRVGRVLRSTSLDELPQLLNVIVGDMSLVGPRPPLPEEVQLYTERQARRLTVKPGLTGLWQVSGRSDCTFEECVRLDLDYIEHWSLWLDLRLLVRTVWIVALGRGAY